MSRVLSKSKNLKDKNEKRKSIGRVPRGGRVRRGVRVKIRR